MIVAGKPFPCLVHRAGTGAAPAAEAAEEPPAPLAPYGRRAIEPRIVPADLTLDNVVPSALQAPEAAAAVPGLSTERCGKPIDLFPERTGAERGVALHRAFEVLGGRAERTDLLARATGLPLDQETLRAIGEAVSAFERWLTERFAPLSLRRELPILGLDENGSVVSGTVDLLVETSRGYWILDHKTDAAEDAAARFSVYRPQLACYANVIGKAFPEKPVLGTGIHWISTATVSLLPSS